MKNDSHLPDDDLRPLEIVLFDRILQRQLETSIAKYFYEACDRPTQALLSKCHWYITTQTKAIILVIECPDAITNWRVLKNLVKLSQGFEQLPSARIRVCPPPGTGTPFDMRIDEISVYRDSL